jgi:hypothetical protein
VASSGSVGPATARTVGRRRPAAFAVSPNA